MTERIIDISLEESIKSGFLEYARAVIEDRALPDARDGLKPVHRRTLYSMHELGMTHDKPFKKSARVIGDVLAKYHPHGDSSVYEALVRMAQDFSMRYPLVHGHGNFGSLDGDNAAAMRYTEARMTEFAEMMMEALDYTVPFGANYDDSLKEPLVLPSKIPNLLLNGAQGIAVGVSTTMLPHHGKEVLKALIARLKDKDVDISKFIKGPDFPTGGVYTNPEGWKSILATGKGKVTIRAKHHIESTKNRQLIVFTEMPYGTKKAHTIEKIVEAVRENRLHGIEDLRDESGKDGIRVVVEIRPETKAEHVLAGLFARTPLETSITVQNVVLVDGKPIVADYATLLDVFTKHRFEVINRKLTYELEKEESKAHILEGQLKVLSDVDTAVAIIKKSKDKDTAHAGLMKAFGLSEKQADAVLALRLQKLTSLETKQLKDDLKESKAIIKQLKHDLAHPEEYLENEWTNMLALFKDPRRTTVGGAEEFVYTAEAHAEEVVVVATDTEIFRQSLRAGEKEGRSVQTNMASTLYGITETGTLIPFKVKELPDVTGGKTKTKALPEPLRFLGTEEEIPEFLVFHKSGRGKRVKPEAGRKILPISTDIDFLMDGEEVLLTGAAQIMVITKMGMVIRFKAEELPVQGKTAAGVRVISLQDGDEILSVMKVTDDTKVTMTTTDGRTKTERAGKVPVTGRAGKGVKSFSPTYSKGGTLLSVSIQ